MHLSSNVYSLLLIDEKSCWQEHFALTLQKIQGFLMVAAHVHYVLLWLPVTPNKRRELLSLWSALLSGKRTKSTGE